MARTRYSILSCELKRENSSADNGCNGGLFLLMNPAGKP
jgi:hypothetical protein